MLIDRFITVLYIFDLKLMLIVIMVFLHYVVKAMFFYGDMKW